MRLPPAGALGPSTALAAEPSGPPSVKQSSIAAPVAAQRGNTPDIHMQLDTLFKSELMNTMQRILMIA